jgi:glycosyltransferase involved in cell wall biosynthesis
LKPCISIAIPAFKIIFLKEAIQSVLNQSFTDFELIIVNDKSPEDLEKVISSFSDSRIKYYKNEINLGKESVVKNWNKCLEYAEGEFFVLFSDDDIYEPEFLQEMYILLKKWPKVDIAHCRVKMIDSDNKIINYSSSCPEYENVIDFMWHRLKGIRIQFAPDFMIRTERLKEIGGFIDFPLAWSSDDATWFQLAKENGVVFLDKPLCNWRSSNTNISKIGSADLKINANIKYSKWINDFINRLDAITEENKFQIKESKQFIQIWKRKNIVNILVRTSGDGILSILNILQNWLKFRKKYQLNFNILLRATFIIIKNILFT